MAYFIQLTSTGVMTGGLYGLVAVGLVLIYKTTKVFNFAQGELLMIGSFCTWWFLTGLGFPLWASFLLMLVCATALGLFLERFLMRPMIGQPMLAIVMLTICLSPALRAVAILIWSGNRFAYPSIIPLESLMVGGLHISPQLLLCFIVALVAIGIFAVFFQRSRTGITMRAVAEGHKAAQACGIKVNRVFAQAWVISAILAGIAGIGLGSLGGVCSSLADIGLVALAVALVGGLESVYGVVVAGLIVGIVESVTTGYLDVAVGGGFGAITPYIVMLLLLLWRPYGLFGLRRIERI